MENHLFDWFVTFGGAVVSWFVKMLWGDLKDMKKDMQHMQTSFISKEDYRNDMTDIRNMLHRILDKLDDKQDKGACNYENAKR